MAIATNTYTITIADAHSHSFSQSGVPGAGHFDAAASVLEHLQGDLLQMTTSGLVATDTWTITISQP